MDRLIQTGGKIINFFSENRIAWQLERRLTGAVYKLKSNKNTKIIQVTSTSS